MIDFVLFKGIRKWLMIDCWFWLEYGVCGVCFWSVLVVGRMYYEDSGESWLLMDLVLFFLFEFVFFIVLLM